MNLFTTENIISSDDFHYFAMAVKFDCLSDQINYDANNFIVKKKNPD